MPRMSHDKADARDRAQTLINLELRRYGRRLKQTAEDYISMAHDEATARGLAFDHEVVSAAAFAEAQRIYFAGELEAGDAQDAA